MNKRSIIPLGLLFLTCIILGVVRVATPPTASTPLSIQEQADIEEQLLAIISDENPEQSIAYLKQKVSDSSIARQCHPLLHVIGKAAYNKYRNFEQASSFQDSFCNSGYLHGVIQAYFSETKDTSEAIANACSQTSTPFAEWQCYHGVGHGVMYATGNDLELSKEWCNTISVSKNASSCINGVFMEQFITVDHSGHTNSLNKNTDITLCGTQEEIYQAVCYIYAPSAYLEKNPNNYIGAFEYCDLAGENRISECVSGLGGQIMKDNIAQPKSVVDFCQLSKTEQLELTCVAGAIDIAINHYASTAAVLPWCSDAFRDYQLLCENVVGKKASDYGI